MAPLRGHATSNGSCRNDSVFAAREEGIVVDLRAYARETAARAGCDPDLFVRQIQQESGFNPEAFNAGSGATGIAQIIARFHPEVNPRDPIASLDYAARWMATLHRQYGTYRKALAAYNWGPGNVAGWNGQRDELPAETCHYLDVILGAGWPEPSGGGAGNGSGTGASDRDAVLYFRVARAGADLLNLRAEPSRSATVKERLADGTLLQPLGLAREAETLVWVQVRAPGGNEGWAAASFLDIAAAAGTVRLTETGRQDEEGAGRASFRVTENEVRLRAQPGRRTRIVEELGRGTIAVDDGAALVIEDGLEWRRVRVGGDVGWIATQFLRPADATCRYQFDASIPTELQVQDWTCSIRSTMWCLKSIGIAVTPAEAQDAMSPRYVNSDVGLLDASGAGIIAVLRDRWGVEAFNRNPVSFDDVAGWAGACPVALGGRRWGHWTAVRGFDGERLVLANPGGTGPRFGQQTLDRQQFADLGSFSAVVIPVE